MRLGGITQMLLTHRDDIADHELFAKEFGCRARYARDDGARKLGVERVLEGEDRSPTR